MTNQEHIKGLSFRARLALFGVVLVVLVALPALVVDVRRPWDALDSLIRQGNAVIAGVEASVPPEDLARMNAFALKVSAEADENLEDPLIWSFNLLLDSDTLPGPEQFQGLAQAAEIGEHNYEELVAADAFWRQRFAAEPGLLEIFRHYKRLLRAAKQNADAGGFDYKDLYIMVDSGEVFAFVIDGLDFSESTYPGLTYDASEIPWFRGYLKSGPGYYSDPRHYQYGVLPKFSTDKWGAWFSTWYAKKNGGNFNSFAMDFSADKVKALMWRVGGVILVIALLEVLVLTLLTHRLTRMISEPIVMLEAATEAVIAADYDHRLPTVGSREFAKAFGVFNQMLKGLKERFNLMQTLERLLSKELAEQVAKHGLVLGGQKVEITNLFTDFAGFSTITRNMTPEQSVSMLNEYFSMLIPIIKKWGGLPDKYIGDAIVAIFGAPVVLDNHAEAAVSCAIEMQLAMRRLNEQRRREGKVTMEMRIGLNSGDVIAGAMGSDMKLEYTTIGETTNLANRMESMCQIGHVLMSGATYEKVKHIFFEGVHVSAEPQLFKVKGYHDPVPAYNVFVADVEIIKSDRGDDPVNFYTINPLDRGRRYSAGLGAEAKACYQKFINCS